MAEDEEAPRVAELERGFAAFKGDLERRVEEGMQAAVEHVRTEVASAAERIRSEVAVSIDGRLHEIEMRFARSFVAPLESKIDKLSGSVEMLLRIATNGGVTLPVGVGRQVPVQVDTPGWFARVRARLGGADR